MSKCYEDFGPPVTDIKICLATTTYGDPDASYTFSIQASREALHKKGYETAYYLLQGNCHVDDARNDIVQRFLASDCTDLVFLDADVSWQPEDLVRLCGHRRDIVGGIYPYRTELGQERIPARMKAGEMVDDDGLVEVEGLPTGFMKLSRNCVEKVCKESKSYVHEGKVYYLAFERALIDGTRWGGDLHFCNKWRSMGGRVFADYEMVLGHAARSIISGSLATYVRKQTHTTLRHVCDKIRRSAWTLADISEALRYVNNYWGAQEEVLAAAICMARDADGPIIETGSGLSTILMAAATDYPVYCLEHDDFYAAKLTQMANEAQVGIALCRVPFTDTWYDLTEFKGLPERFALGLNDGPPRYLGGDRTEFFMRFKCDKIIADDANDPTYAEFLYQWAEAKGMTCEIYERMAVIR